MPGLFETSSATISLPELTRTAARLPAPMWLSQRHLP
jgi:hypothetical protein